MDSLTQWQDVRRQAARAGSFRGYQPGPVAVSGMVGVAAAFAQRWMVPTDVGFVALWICAAFLGSGYNLFCIARTYGASPRRWERSLAFNALSDLSPAVIAGALLTLVFTATNRVELLPGLWMILFGSGILASRRHLPWMGTAVGGVYLLFGLMVLWKFQGDAALRAGVMGGVFGGGQLLLAAVLSRVAR